MTRKTKIAIQARIILVSIDVKSPSVGHACLTGANYSMQRYGMPTLGLSFVSQQKCARNKKFQFAMTLGTWRAIPYITWVKMHVPVVRASVCASCRSGGRLTRLWTHAGGEAEKRA